jgi:hypothetical protein
VRQIALPAAGADDGRAAQPSVGGLERAGDIGDRLCRLGRRVVRGAAGTAAGK